MMPTGESGAAVIGACLILGMIWFVASGHFAGTSQVPHSAMAGRPSLNANGGPITPPEPRRSAG